MLGLHFSLSSKCAYFVSSTAALIVMRLQTTWAIYPWKRAASKVACCKSRPSRRAQLCFCTSSVRFAFAAYLWAKRVSRLVGLVVRATSMGGLVCCAAFERRTRAVAGTRFNLARVTAFRIFETAFYSFMQ